MQQHWSDGRKNWGIKMTDKSNDDAFLDQFFEAAQTRRPEPSPELLARILADAEHAQNAMDMVTQRQSRVIFWREIAAYLGGWQGITGLATAGLAGFWLGTSSLIGFEDVALWTNTGPEQEIAQETSVFDDFSFDFAVLEEG